MTSKNEEDRTIIECEDKITRICYLPLFWLLLDIVFILSIYTKYTIYTIYYHAFPLQSVFDTIFTPKNTSAKT